MPTLGDAFLFTVSRSHLWVVISNPAGPLQQFVMVNLTTLNEKFVDESCILEQSDYPEFLKHKTAVYYDKAKLWQVFGERGYNQIFDAKKITPMPKMSNPALLRIQQGAIKSNFFAPDYKPLVQDSLVALFQTLAPVLVPKPTKSNNPT